jgi:hypothetical protein
MVVQLLNPILRDMVAPMAKRTARTAIMKKVIAEPSGQLDATPNWLAMAFPIICPSLPPNKAGVT